MGEYYGLQQDSIDRAQQAAGLLRRSLRIDNASSIADGMAIGRQFAVMRTMLSKAMFAEWVKNEVGVSRRTAQRYIALFAARPIQPELAESLARNRNSRKKSYIDSVDTWLL